MTMAGGTFARRSPVAGDRQGYRKTTVHLGNERGRLTLWILVVVVGLVFLSAERAHAKVESENLIPPEIKELANVATELSKLYAIGGSAVALLKFFGMLEEKQAAINEGFILLHDDLNRIYDLLEVDAAREVWRNRKQLQNDRMAAALTAAQIAEQFVLSKPPDPISLSSPACEASKLCSDAALETMKDSHTAVNQAISETQFGRYYLPGDRNQSRWGSVVKDSASEEAEQSVGYDWRVGINHLMHLIALRLQVIAAYDFDFKNNPAFQRAPRQAL
jgi:hypothetical protein